jgi:hypothetical protein
MEICKRCKWAGKCGASSESDFCINYEPRPLTNADRIRAMTDAELAEFIGGNARTFGEEYEGYMSALDWLRKEAPDES